MPSITITTDITSSGDTLHRDEQDYTTCCIEVKGMESPMMGLSLYCVEHKLTHDFNGFHWVKDNRLRKDHQRLRDLELGWDSKLFLIDKCLLPNQITINKKKFPLSKKYQLNLSDYPRWKIICQGYDKQGQPTNESCCTDPFVIKSKRPINVQDEENKQKGYTIERKKRKRKCKSCQELSHQYHETSKHLLTIQTQKDFYEQAYKKTKKDIQSLHQLIKTHPHVQESAFLQAALRITQPVENNKTKRF